MCQMNSVLGKKFHKKNHQIKRQTAYLREQLALIGPAHLGLTGYDPYLEFSSYDDDPEYDSPYDWEDDWESELEMGSRDRRYDDSDYIIFDDYLDFMNQHDDPFELGEFSN